MSSVKVSHPTKIINGTVNLPASKSIANRLLLMKAVAGFTDVEIHNLSNARDTQILESILNNLSANATIDVHDAGTVMRFLTAYVSCLEGEWIITGTERMQQRPIGALVNVLRNIGAEIEYLKNENYPPLKIRGKQLKGGKIEIDGSISSQFISALLMISPLFTEPLELHIKNDLVSKPYVDMTLKLMQQWGINYTWKENVISIDNKPYQKPTEKIFVESDWSAASYFYSILSLAKQGEITLPYLFKNSLQGDCACIELFADLGVSTAFTNDGVVLKKTNQAKNKIEYNFLNCPDIAQTLAVCYAAKNVQASLQGLQTLSIKETDRIDALKTELGKFGVELVISANSIQINSKFKAQDSKIETYKDHRMAMSFAPLALCCNTIEIENPTVAEKSFPHFWDELKKTGFTIQYK
ncbi:MAG TPA: 3-phosphoshikimate 1-carboxyvinyltransferase [Bacteroidia bacterium]|nr:3-phosphoshikimate 1-carboxyvinyltransferase [Bacteroidia bacterium]